MEATLGCSFCRLAVASGEWGGGGRSLSIELCQNIWHLNHACISIGSQTKVETKDFWSAHLVIQGYLTQSLGPFVAGVFRKP